MGLGVIRVGLEGFKGFIEGLGFGLFLEILFIFAAYCSSLANLLETVFFFGLGFTKWDIFCCGFFCLFEIKI